MLRCSVKCLGQTALKTATAAIPQCPFFSSTHFPSSGGFPSGCLPAAPINLANLHQALQPTPHRSADIVVKCICALVLQPVLSSTGQQLRPWRDRTFPTAVNWAERGKLHPLQISEPLSLITLALLSGHQSLECKNQLRSPVWSITLLAEATGIWLLWTLWRDLKQSVENWNHT